MTSTDRFSLSRTGSIFKKYMLENWKVMLMRFILMIGILTIGAILIAWSDFSSYEYMDHYKYNTSTQSALTVFFTFTGYFFGCLMASLAMESMKSKTGRISTFMTPATQLEKYIVRWFIAVPLFIVLFLGCCAVADLIRCAFTLMVHPEYSQFVHPIDIVEVISYNTYEGEQVISNGFYVLLYIFILAQSFFVLGSSVWPRNSLLKTFTAIAIIGTVYGVLFAIGGELMSGRDLTDESIMGQIDDSDINWTAVWGIIISVIAIFNYVLAYYRYKEMEIIQRM